MINDWGRPLWAFLHEMAIEYPNNPTNQQKNNMMKFIKSLATILP